MARRRETIELRVAERVRALREEQGLSQGQLARLAGIARSSVTDLEAAKKSVSVGALAALARALSVPVEQLVAEAQQNPGKPDAADGLATVLRAKGPDYIQATRSLIKALDRVAERARAEGEQESAG
ncbi:MAG: helix-turn-helix domain-containing protein [Planctomycetota bacterium]